MEENRSMPPGTIVPEFVCDDLGAAVAWRCEAFGFRARLRIGDHRCQLVFGDASVVRETKIDTRDCASTCQFVG